MSISERFPHYTPEQVAKYERVLGKSPKVQCVQAPAAPQQTGPKVCKHRGDEVQQVGLRRCCGRKQTAMVPAWRCELLDCVCITSGQPAERGIESCSMCSEFDAAK